MQQVQPSIWVLLSKSAAKNKGCKLPGIAMRSLPRIGSLESGISGLPQKTEHSAEQTPTAESFFVHLFFENFFLFHRPGKRWENCWLASMEAAAPATPPSSVPSGHSFSPVFGRSWWRSTCQRWAWSYMTLISVGIFALDWPWTERIVPRYAGNNTWGKYTNLLIPLVQKN